MKVVNVRNIAIGEGAPKICIPLSGEQRDELLREAGNINILHADIAEWRADLYKDMVNDEEMLSTLGELRTALGDAPLLFTLRTEAEGGRFAAGAVEYERLCTLAIESGCVDLIDLEYDMGEQMLYRLIERARLRGVSTIASHHNFEMTYAEDEIVSRLREMQGSGADIVKIAVMPNDNDDVWALMHACEIVKRNEETCHVIAISMGRLGSISRIVSEAFGSDVTFASAGASTAPGQIDAEDLRTLIDAIHKLRFV